MATAAREDDKQAEQGTTKGLSYLDALEHEADGLSGCRRRWPRGGGGKTQGNEAEIYYNNTKAIVCGCSYSGHVAGTDSLAATLMKCSGSRKTENGARKTDIPFKKREEGSTGKLARWKIKLSAG